MNTLPCQAISKCPKVRIWMDFTWANNVNNQPFLTVYHFESMTSDAQTSFKEPKSKNQRLPIEKKLQWDQIQR